MATKTRIIDNRTHTTPIFEDIQRGDVFFQDDILYMKIPAISDECCDDYNAVRLDDGDLCYFDDGEIIEPINEIEIKVG